MNSRLLAPTGLTPVGIEPETERTAVYVAHRVTLSPHEWTWTPEEVEAMARYCLYSAQRLDVIKRIAEGEPWAIV